MYYLAYNAGSYITTGKGRVVEIVYPYLRVYAEICTAYLFLTHRKEYALLMPCKRFRLNKGEKEEHVDDVFTGITHIVTPRISVKGLITLTLVKQTYCRSLFITSLKPYIQRRR